MFRLRRELAAKVFRKPNLLIDRLSLLPKFEAWRQAQQGVPIHKSREDLYGALASQIAGPITYLEFGVFRGHSMRCWTALNDHRSSRFVGFDTFTGLPEIWQASPDEQFDAGGALPQFADTRVSFVKGLFQNTLPEVLANFSAQGQLIVHVDCDLYSAALFVLATLNPFMPKGTIIIFDEFYVLEDEFAAWLDYTSAFYRSGVAIGATSNFCQSALRLD